jgi:hypothetical protein
VLLLCDIDWSAISAISTAVYALFTLGLIITGIVGIKITVRQLEESRSQLKIRNLQELIQQFDSREFKERRQRLAEKRIDRGKLKPLDIDDAPTEMDEVLDFFEYIGLLYKMKYLDIYPIWHTLGYWMFSTYADARDYIEQERKDDKASLEDFCKLVEDLRVVEREHGSGWDTPSPEDKFDFYDWERRNPSKPARKRKKGTKKKTVTGETT